MVDLSISCPTWVCSVPKHPNFADCSLQKLIEDLLYRPITEGGCACTAFIRAFILHAIWIQPQLLRKCLGYDFRGQPYLLRQWPWIHRDVYPGQQTYMLIKGLYFLGCLQNLTLHIELLCLHFSTCVFACYTQLQLLDMCAYIYACSMYVLILDSNLS